MPEGQENATFSNLLNSWADMQEKLWGNWFGIAKSQTGDPLHDTPAMPADMAEEILDCGLKFRAHMVEVWATGFRVGSDVVPKLYREQTSHLEKIFTNCSATQRRIAASWIESVNAQDLFRLTNLASPDQVALDAWQEATRRGMEMQTQWANLVAQACLIPLQGAATEAGPVGAESADAPTAAASSRPAKRHPAARKAA